MYPAFNFPSRALYGVSIDIHAPFNSEIRNRERSESLKSLNSSLIGTWNLESYYAASVADASDVYYPLGKDAKGVLMYSADGYMTAILLRPGQAGYASRDPGTASNPELAESSKRYLGYSGPYYLDESGDRPTVRHVMNLVNFPNWMGNIQTRVIDLSGDKLTLGLERVIDMNGTLRNPLLIFDRAPRNDVTSEPPPGRSPSQP